MTQTDAPAPPSPKRRHAAGADPDKRRQILRGAWQVFLEQGFDAASMNAVCKAAGVSKGTIYVYFEHKEDLFFALVEDMRARFFRGISEPLAGPGCTEDRLRSYATGLARQLTSEEVVRAQRIVVAVVERMPHLGQRFYDAGARHVLNALSGWLAAEATAGRLRIDDPELAAQQFLELSTAGLWRQRVFGRRLAPPDEAEITRTAEAAVRVFLAAYGPES